MPWVAMALGQGTNAVIYKTTPCVLDVTRMKNAVLNVDFGDSDEGVALAAEYQRFNGECHVKAMKVIRDMADGKYGKEISSKLYNETEAIARRRRSFLEKIFRSGSTTTEEQLILWEYVDSPLIQELIYNPNSALASWGSGVSTIPMAMNADNPVNGYNGYMQDSPGQEKAGTPPSCYEWWNGGNGIHGLKGRIVSALSDDVVYQTLSSSSMNIPQCRYNPREISVYLTETERKNAFTAKKASCKQEIIRQIYQGDEDGYGNQLLTAIQKDFAKDSTLKSSDNAKLLGSAAAIIGGTILSRWTGVDVSGGLLGSITGFYATIFMLKLLLRYFIPMILMAIYMFWGIYMVIGELRGSTMVKGMILIFALTIMPGLWAITEHLDDKLWAAMYGTSRLTDAFNALLLDAATGIFQITIVFVLFFLINQAGGGDASSVVNPTQSEGRNLARGLGGFAGNSTGKATGYVKKGLTGGGWTAKK